VNRKRSAFQLRLPSGGRWDRPGGRWDRRTVRGRAGTKIAALL